MPINDKNLGKYIRPDIYVEYVDKSEYIEPPIQEVLTNLVPGFSKKGPYNKPVKVSNANEFINIYGDIDRNMENKGSYFHKTVLNMLERGPIWALNLLKTDPSRDKVNWKSISVSAKYDNSAVKTAAYEYMFNRQDFWELSTFDFQDIVNDDNGSVEVTDKLLNITNVQDKNLTVFAYKSSVSGFDVTAEFWYGGRENVPSYMNYNDWISDYMISILVIGGDWTNYTQLSVDPYWSKYFNSTGIKKTQIQNFVNDKNITVVAYYDASLIPNFKDLNGKNMYVQTVINNDTDQTGLFCAYNEDALLSTDAYMGRIDLLGQTLVNNAKKDIDFLSYNDSIMETKQYDITYLDAAGNVFGNYDGALSGWTTGVNRTAQWTNWYTSGITSAAAVDQSGYTQSLFTVEADSGITLTTPTYFGVDDVIYFTKSWGIISSATAYYIVNVDGGAYQISTTLGGSPIIGLNTTDFDTTSLVYTLGWTFDLASVTLGDTFYNIGSTRYTTSGLTTTAYMGPMSISDTGGTYSKYDVLYLTSDNTKINVLSGSQVSGTTASRPNFTPTNTSTIILGYVLTTFSAGSFTLAYTAVTVDDSGYTTLDIDIYSGTTAGQQYYDIVFTGTYGSSSTLNDYDKLRKLKVYDELATKLVTNKGVIVNVTDGTKYPIVDPTFVDESTTTNALVRIYVDDYEAYTSGDAFLVYYIDNEFTMAGTTVSTITSVQADYVSSTGTTIGQYSGLYQDFYNGYINNYDYIYLNNDTGTTQKIYLKFVMTNATLAITFLNQYTPTEVTTSIVRTNYSNMLVVYSDKSNWKQTVDVVNSGITDLTNTRSIYVDKTRYAEIKRGDFLEAYYDTSYYDSPGEGYVLGYIPRKFTRVISITNATDGVNKILNTDAPVKLTTYSGTTLYYTNIYPSIDTYFDEYKGIYLAGFNVSSESLPDGTDTRLDTILSVLDQDTKLAKGLSNKNRISWRYLVDSFGLGLSTTSKQELVDLCGNKVNCLGFINMPSVKQLKKSTDPSFIDTDNTLNTTYLKNGGDDTKNPSFLYSFGTGAGESCSAYFFPYIKDSDDITRFYPPASYAARTYMNKFVSSIAGIQPWTTVAGTIYGVIPDIYSTEMSFSYDNLDDLYQMGANPITYVMNRGFIINSENTAQVWPQTMLSLIHTRETLIELENRIYDMLLNYQWRFNNQDTRSEIKYRADQICKELKEAGALYDYRNVIDSTNNTTSIIEAKMGVLDTYVEIEKGMGIIVNQITILRKGVIESGGFLTT